MRRLTLALAAATIATALLGAAPRAGAAGPELKTDEDKTFYALGLALSRNLATFNLTPAELDIVKAGLSDGVLGTPNKDVDPQAMGPKLQELARTRTAAAAEKEKKAGAEYLEKAAKEKGAVKTESGVVYIETKAGTGAAPKATDKVKVHYTGKLTDGTVFDSSVERGQPATFPLNGVIKCWTEGVQKMKVGGKAQLVCPSDVAYGDRGAPPKIKPGSTLVFDVELLDIEAPAPPAEKGAAAPAAPAAKPGAAAAKPEAAKPAH